MDKKLLARFYRQLDCVQSDLDGFHSKFEEDPAYALKWSNDVFKNAAFRAVLMDIIKALEGGKATLDNIKTTLTSKVLHGAKYPPQSTSPTSNLIEQYEIAACAEILSDLEYFE